MQLLGTGKQRSAKTCRIAVGSGPQHLTFASFEVNMKGDDLPTVNFESYNVSDANTFDEGILGKIGCDLRFGGDWDAGTTPIPDPPGLYPRDDLSNLLFIVNRTDSTQWDFPYARLRSSTNGGEVNGKVTFQCSGMNQGFFGWDFPDV